MNTPWDKWQDKPIYDRPLGLAAAGPTAVGHDHAGADGGGRSSVWITDFSSCTPAEHLADWRLIDYATDDFAGQMLHAPNNRPGDTLALELNVTGWYAVYVWLMGGDSNVSRNAPDCDSVYSMSAGPALKLTDDKRYATRFRTLSQDQMFWPGLEACFWKYVDLTDQMLSIKHQGSTVYLGAIELIPLDPAEIDVIKADRESREHKRLIVKADDYTEENRRLYHELIRHSDVRAWIAGCHATEDLMTPGGAPSLHRLCEDMHELGVEAYACDRPSLWSSYNHHDDSRIGDFNVHPQWHCLDRDGTPTHQASYAHPEVQDYMLKRVRAAAETGIDGYGFYFNRDPGMVLFEPVAMRGFEEGHGVDPCTLSDRDERLLDWRADIITGFLRRMRDVLDEVAAEKGVERMKLVHVVLGDAAANRFFSFDVERWVREGLVDVLCPYPWTDYPDRWLAQGFVAVDVAHFTAMCKNTSCQVYPMWLTSVPGLYNWTQEHIRPREYFTKAMADYAAGADGISTWDAVGLGLFYPFMSSRWLRLGHKDQLAMWAEHDFPLPPKRRFTRYRGRTVNRYPAGTGG